MIKVNNRILIISRNVPPRYTGTSVVIENLATAFSSNELLILGEKLVGTNQKLNSEMQSKLRYVTILFRTNIILTHVLRKVQIITGLLLILINCIRFLPQKIIIVYPSAEYLFMGYLLSILYKADYYTYFHNTYYENRSGFKKKIANWLQNKSFQYSKIIFCISDGLTGYFKNAYIKYADKFETIVHSYTEELPSKINVTISGRPKVAFVGNLNESCKDAGERLFSFLSEIQNIEFHIFASRMSKTYFYELGLNQSQLYFYKALKRNELIYELRKMDIMLLPHGFNGELPFVEYETIFPTKAVEYLISGKPIFLYSPEKVFLTDLFRRTNAALVVTDIDKETVIKRINDFIDDSTYREKIVIEAYKLAGDYNISKVVVKLKDLLFNSNK